MATAKSGCFIQDKNIDIITKQQREKLLEFSRYFRRTIRPSSGDLENNRKVNLSLWCFVYLGILNTFSLSFLNFNFVIAGQNLEGIQKVLKLASCNFSPIESHFHQVYV